MMNWKTHYSANKILVFTGLAFVFVLLCLPFLNRLPDTWECLNFSACRHAALSGIPTKTDEVFPDNLLLAHPPSWVYTVALSFRILGIGLWQARLPGLIIVILTAWVLFLLARRAFSERTAWMAAALYLTNPGTIQGALYIGYSEGTYLPLAVTLFCWAWLEFQSVSCFRHSVILAMAIAFAFWAKGTTSLALPLCLFIVILFQVPADREIPMRWGVRILTWAGSVGGGAGLFLFTWALAAWGISRITGVDYSYVFQRPLSYLWSEGGRSTQVSMGTNLWTDIPIMSVRAVIYIGPWLWLGALWATARQVRSWWKNRGLAPEDIILLCVWSISAVFVILHGGTGGFPKNHFAILPLLCLLCAMAFDSDLIKGGINRREFCLILGIGIVYSFFLVGDPVRVLNHTLRHVMMIGATLRPVSFELAVRLVFYLALPIVSMWMMNFRFDRSRIAGRLLAAILASQVGLVLCQALGGYFLAYSYGSPIRDLKNVIDILNKETVPSDPILALPELACGADRPAVQGLGRVQWRDPAALANILEIQRPKAMVYGMPAHPLDQIQMVFKDPRVRIVMQRDYELLTVGDYRVWIRRGRE